MLGWTGRRPKYNLQQDSGTSSPPGDWSPAPLSIPMLYLFPPYHHPSIVCSSLPYSLLSGPLLVAPLSQFSALYFHLITALWSCVCLSVCLSLSLSLCLSPRTHIYHWLRLSAPLSFSPFSLPLSHPSPRFCLIPPSLNLLFCFHTFPLLSLSVCLSLSISLSLDLSPSLSLFHLPDLCHSPSPPTSGGCTRAAIACGILANVCVPFCSNVSIAHTFYPRYLVRGVSNSDLCGDSNSIRFIYPFIRKPASIVRGSSDFSAHLLNIFTRNLINLMRESCYGNLPLRNGVMLRSSWLSVV